MTEPASMTRPTEPTNRLGALRVTLDIPSYQLQNHLPIEVRDSRLNLVGTLLTDETLKLDPGWYEVSAVLDDGQRHSKTVKISADDTEHVQFRIDTKSLLPSSKLNIPKRRMRGGLFSKTERTNDNNLVTFLQCDEADLINQNTERWEFVPKNSRPGSMPTAHLKVLGDELSVSLPVNPKGHGDLAACVMTFVSRSYGVDVRAGFHPERRVSAAIENMVDNCQFAHATMAAEQTAEDMLRSKYSDPVGAALGAIIMYRAGTLSGRIQWLRNLTRDFDWLPDGKILLASLPQESEVEETASLLLAASQQRPLFTESFSLLLDALRLWRSDHRKDEIRKALQQVASQAKHVEWSAFTLTTRKP